MVQRYGLALLTGGYTALPTYAWVYYARLGVTEAEMVLIAQLCTYWWSSRDPFPGEATLASRMGKTVRTIQGYLRALERKGLLHIQTQFSTNGRQSTNSYDLRPFFTAVEGLARLDGLLPDDDATPATPTPSPRAGNNEACNKRPCDQNTSSSQGAEREPLCAGGTSCGTENRPKDPITLTMGEGDGSRAGGVKNLSPQVNPIEIENFDYDSIPPTPINASSGPTTSDNPTDQTLVQTLVQEIAALSAELGDNAPVSSVTRARNLCCNAGISPERFLRLLDEAAARTRDRQASIVKRRRDDTSPNGMPYLFAVLTDLLYPAPPQTRDVGPDRPHAERPGRRRRRRDGDPVSTYASWQGTAERLPITEANPVWRAALDELALVLTVENFNMWLASTRVTSQWEGLLHIAVPTPFNKQWLEGKLHSCIMGVMERLGYGNWQVQYVVEAA